MLCAGRDGRGTGTPGLLEARGRHGVRDPARSGRGRPGWSWVLRASGCGLLACLAVAWAASSARPGERGFVIAGKEVRRWAIVVGISDYLYDTRKIGAEGIPDLKGAAGDARAFHRFLVEEQGIPGERVNLLTDSQATWDRIRGAFVELEDRVGPEDLLLVFFSGHGVTGQGTAGKSYLVAYDSDPRKLKDKGILFDDFSNWLQGRIRANKKVLIVDACHSGSFLGSIKGPDNRINDYMLEKLRQAEGTAFITASKGGEVSVEDAAGGIFTRAWIEGLRGRADDDRDGLVTVDEAYGYARKRVKENRSTSQTPLRGGDYDTDLPLSVVAGGAAVVERPPEPGGSCGHPDRGCIEVSSTPSGATVTVDGAFVGSTPVGEKVLAPGRHVVAVSKPGYEPYRKEVELEGGRTLSLEAYLEPPVPRKGRLALDAEPAGARVRFVPGGEGYSRGMELEPGSYELEVSASGYESRRVRVEVAVNEEKHVAVLLRERGGSQGAADSSRLDSVDAFKAERRQLEVQLVEALSGLASKKEIPSLLQNISNLGRECGLEMPFFKPGAEVKKEFYAEVPVDIKVGGSFQNMLRFFHEVGSLPRIVTIGDLTIQQAKNAESPNRLEAACKAVVYKVLEEWQSVQLAQVEDRKEGRKEQEAGLGELENRLQVIRGLRIWGEGVPLILDSITGAIPEKTFLDRITLRGTRLSVMGCAFDIKSLSAFTKGLERSPLLSGVELRPATNEVVGGVQMYRFVLEMVAKPTASALGKLKDSERESSGRKRQGRVEEGEERLPRLMTSGGASGAPAGMVYIPGGTFWMGCVPGDTECSDDEKPRHQVTVDSFYLDAHEVTVTEYGECVRGGVCKTPKVETSGTYAYAWNWGKSDRSDHPVNGVDWEDAGGYCGRAGKRLPTEAEFEYALRGGKDGARPPQGYGNYADESARRVHRGLTIVEGYGDRFVGTSPVRSFSSNGFGLYDISGNVWEWCADWFGADYYVTRPGRNPSGPGSGTNRVLRGGSWSDIPGYVRSSGRNYDTPGNGSNNIGFRCARD